jgi:hypothetical protein
MKTLSLSLFWVNSRLKPPLKKIVNERKCRATVRNEKNHKKNRGLWRQTAEQINSKRSKDNKVKEE